MDKSNAAIKRYVDSEASSEMLFKSIENYNRFAAKLLCEVGFYQKDMGQKPYALRDFTLNYGSTLRMWGFNSVLVCDAADDVNKMFVDPSAAEIIRCDDGVTHLVMCHHPFNWLRNSAEFQNRIEAVSKIQLFGHEHNLRVDDFRRFTRIKAGALHPERDEQGWQPGYNLIDLSVSGPPPSVFSTSNCGYATSWEHAILPFPTSKDATLGYWITSLAHGHRPSHPWLL